MVTTSQCLQGFIIKSIWLYFDIIYKMNIRSYWRRLETIDWDINSFMFPDVTKWEVESSSHKHLWRQPLQSVVELQTQSQRVEIGFRCSAVIEEDDRSLIKSFRSACVISVSEHISISWNFSPDSDSDTWTCQLQNGRLGLSCVENEWTAWRPCCDDGQQPLRGREGAVKTDKALSTRVFIAADASDVLWAMPSPCCWRLSAADSTCHWVEIQPVCVCVSGGGGGDSPWRAANGASPGAGGSLVAPRCHLPSWQADREGDREGGESARAKWQTGQRDPVHQRGGGGGGRRRPPS